MAQKLTVKKVYDTIRDFVYDTKRGCNFLAKKAKKGCMTQKCMTQNVLPKKVVLPERNKKIRMVEISYFLSVTVGATIN